MNPGTGVANDDNYLFIVSSILLNFSEERTYLPVPRLLITYSNDYVPDDHQDNVRNHGH